MQATAPPSPSAYQLVRVWFGAHIVCAYAGEKTSAERYAKAMRRRFVGLEITVDLRPAEPAGRVVPPLPSERLWELVP